MLKDQNLNYILIYNEMEDAICSFELFVEELPKVMSRPHHWKWAVISLHNSLQGFMILSLGNMQNILKTKSFEEWEKRFEPGEHKLVPLKLKYFNDLYKQIKSDTMKRMPNSKPFVPNSTHDRSVSRLNNLRNEFTHYIPSDRAFNLRDRAKDLLDVVSIIEFLVKESNNILFAKKSRYEYVIGLCKMAKSEISTLLEYYSE